MEVGYQPVYGAKAVAGRYEQVNPSGAGGYGAVFGGGVFEQARGGRADRYGCFLYTTKGIL